MKKKFLTVYTVSLSDYNNDSLAHNVSGSYLHRGDAIRECVNDVLTHIDCSLNLLSWFIDGEFGNVLRKESIDPDDAYKMLRDISAIRSDDKASSRVLDMAREYISDVIGSDGCFYLDNVRFDVDENDVECRDGLQLWTCITSGRDDECHDQEFEQAFPDVFLSEGDAVDCAINNLKSYLEGYSKEEIQTIVNEATDSINEHGHFEFDLNDSKTRIWDIWSTPMDIGQGCHVKRTTRR